MHTQTRRSHASTSTYPRYPPTRAHCQRVLCSRYASVDLWMSVSVCWECLSSPCFWASCQAQLPAVLGQGNTMALNVAHHPPSILYQLGKKVVQREDKEVHVTLYRNTHRYSIYMRTVYALMLNVCVKMQMMHLCVLYKWRVGDIVYISPLFMMWRTQWRSLTLKWFSGT